MTLWTFLAFALDAIAIAAQAITGRYLGAGDVAGTRAVTRRMVQWGVVSGVVTGAAARGGQPRPRARCSPPDPAVRDLLVPVLLVAALGQPVAGRRVRPRRRADRRRRRPLPRLGGAGRRWSSTRRWPCSPPALAAGLVAVWVAFSVVFMGARLVVLVHRARGDAWLVTGTRVARAVPDRA